MKETVAGHKQSLAAAGICKRVSQRGKDAGSAMLSRLTPVNLMVGRLIFAQAEVSFTFKDGVQCASVCYSLVTPQVGRSISNPQDKNL